MEVSSDNNNEMKNEFHNDMNDMVCVDEIRIKEAFNYKEPYNTNNKQGSVQNHSSIKDESMDDLTVVVRKGGLIPDCIGNKMCLNETVISEEYIKQESCDMKDVQGSLQNYQSIQDENIDDLTVIAQKTEVIQIYRSIKDENIDDLTIVERETKPMIDCIDNKVYETIISGRCIKEEPCDMEDESRNITHNNVAMKGCEECGEEYDLYCLKCPMLIRIFDGNDPNCENNRVRRTLPRNLIDIHKTSTGVGIVALRAIPKGVVFGPFKGLDSTNDGTVSKWKLKNNELVYTKGSRWLNWMQYVKKADQSSHPNLTPFQYKDELYYRSDCHISMGDKLLICWDSALQDIEDYYWEPQICEILDDTYACTFCCVGYKSISHLEAHNFICLEKRNRNDFCKEILQCDICKIYLDKKEYSDYHRDRCYKSNQKCAFNSHCRRTSGRSLRNRIQNVDRPSSCTLRRTGRKIKSILKQDIVAGNNHKPFACTLCPYKTTRESYLKRHIVTHNADTPFACSLCPYRTTTNWNLKRHVAIHDGDKSFACTLCRYKTTQPSNLKRHITTHNADTPFACTLCPYKTTTNSNLKRHLAIHDGDKSLVCTLCPYKTTRKSYLKRHIVAHNDDTTFACTLCSYKATTKGNLKLHIAIHDGDKLFACNLCPYETTQSSNLKRHITTHKADTPLAYTLCPYKTTTNSNLERHVAIHEGDKPFACSLCPYKAKRKSDLKEHIAIHNVDKQFQCVLCSYKTTRKSVLKKHIAIHNDGRPYACTLCSYKTRTNPQLNQHVASHINSDK